MSQSINASASERPPEHGTLGWSRYRDRYRLTKVELPGFPKGRVGRVTVCRRNGTILLRWRQDGRQQWETVGEAADQDTMPRAVLRASEINRDLSSGSAKPGAFLKTSIFEACDFYLAGKEAAPDVSGATITKYRTELAKVIEFAETTPQGRRKQSIHEVTTAWCEDFALWLDAIKSTRNGNAETANNPTRPLSSKGKRGIKRRTWAMFEHARLRTPPLVPPTFRNPMALDLIGRQKRAGNGVSDPPVSVEDLVRIVEVADAYQLGLLAPLFLYGPRPSELGRILRIDYDPSAASMRVISRPRAGYETKGRLDKAWPVTQALAACLRPFLTVSAGPLFRKRKFVAGDIRPALLGATEEVLAHELEARKASETGRMGRQLSKAEVDRISAATWSAAGAVDARDVLRELKRAAVQAGLEKVPTPKDIRHLVESEAEAARLSPGVIRHLLGHAPARGDALPHYNHTGRGVLQEQVSILDERRSALIRALTQRTSALSEP